MHLEINLFTHLILLSTLLFLAGCGHEPTDAELLAQDRLELQGMLATNKIMSWKFVKMAVRASAAPADNPELQAFKAKGDPLFARIIRLEDKEKKGGSANVLDYIGLYRDYLTLKAFVKKTDEDIFPTLTEALGEAYSADSIPTKVILTPSERRVQQNLEHTAFSTFALLTQDIGTEIAFYECVEIEPQYLPDTEVKTLLSFFQSFVFLEKGLFYLSEDVLTYNLRWLETHDTVPLPFMQTALQQSGLDSAKTGIAYHGLNHLVRGLDRLMMARDIDQERALQDLQAFVDDARKAGLDNEVVWMVQAYLGMQQEDSNAAIAALQKLKASPLLGADEKAALDETILYLDDRDPDQALNKVYDNVLMAKIFGQYMLAQLVKIDWKQLMLDHDVPYTEEIFATIDRIQEIIKNIDRYTDTDVWEDVGSEVGQKVIVEGEKMTEEVTEEVTEEGGNLWDRIKAWWNE